MKNLSFLFFIISIFTFNTAFTQSKISISGKIIIDRNTPLEGVYIINTDGNNDFSISDKNGNYKITTTFKNQDIVLAYRLIGFETAYKTIYINSEETSYSMDVRMASRSYGIDTVSISSTRIIKPSLIELQPRVINNLPSITGGVKELLMPFISGAMNELSSSYSVRGGNYDENLIYVNDIEVYRPQLVRSGQQEGMGFVNSDLISNIKFSNGGFSSKYGDKMSSVLDITYKRPDTTRLGFTAGFMGGSIFFEGIDKSKKLRILSGARYRTLSGLLSTLDTKGDYQPRFADFQNLISYVLSKNWELSLLSTASMNSYNVYPQSRETVFGTVKEALLLRVFFEGKELTEYQTLMNAFTAKYISTDGKTQHKFIASNYLATEKEHFDVEGAYFLGVLDNDLGSSNFGKVSFNRGYGGFQSYGRNQLNVTVSEMQWKMKHQKNADGIHWDFGASVRNDNLKDVLYEWKRVDSAGFSVPQSNDSTVHLEEFTSFKNNINSFRLTSYATASYDFDYLENIFTLEAGIRFNYWTFNQQFIPSPRFVLSMKPDWKEHYRFKVSGGVYAQPPFYREMRNFSGQINQNILAQKSYHFITGMDRYFMVKDREFKFSTEAYYKYLTSLIPYEIDNVRIRYYANNEAVGFAKGVEFRLNGQLVKDLESWVSLGFMSTKEDLLNDSYVDAKGVTIFPGYIRRPTDQRFNFAIQFQDYLPKFPSYKVHLNLFYGSRLPTGPPDYTRYKDTFTYPPYRRVDIGFSKEIIGGNAKELRNKSFLSSFDALTLQLDIFNLFQIQNTISYLWVRDSFDRQYAVPNYLTNRQINLKLIGKFGSKKPK